MLVFTLNLCKVDINGVFVLNSHFDPLLVVVTPLFLFVLIILLILSCI